MNLHNLAFTSGFFCILCCIIHMIINILIILKYVNIVKFQIFNNTLLIVIGISMIIWSISAYINTSMTYLVHSIFLIIATIVLTYAVITKIAMIKIRKELKLKVSDNDK